MRGLLLTAGVVALLVITGPTHAAGDAAAGKAKTASCAGCHGANGEGTGSNPPLAGKSEGALAQAMRDYKSGKRDNAMMKGFVSKLGDQDIDNLAAYYASLKK